MYAEWYEDQTFSQLIPVLSQLQSAQREMDRQLLLQVVDTLSPWWFGSGVNLFAYNDPSKTKAQNEAAEWASMDYTFNLTEDWFNMWVGCSTSSWVYVFMNVVLDPPRGWERFDEDFCRFFLKVAGKFPLEAVQMCSLVLNDAQARPRLERLLHDLVEQVEWFEGF